MNDTTPKIIRFVDLDLFTPRGFLEPADDLPIFIYSVAKEGLVDLGDVAYRKQSGQRRYYDVAYATTRRYPAGGCGNPCSGEPWQLFVQLARIADAKRLASIEEETDTLAALPF